MPSNLTRIRGPVVPPVFLFQRVGWMRPGGAQRWEKTHAVRISAHFFLLQEEKPACLDDMGQTPVNEMEQLVLLALARLEDGAYGVPIREQIEQRAGRAVSIAAVYAALDRLRQRGLAESWLSGPLPERGGRARKHFRLTAAGAAALLEARASMDRMWEGLELRSDLPDR